MRSGTEMTQGEIDSLIARLKNVAGHLRPEQTWHFETIWQVITVLQQHPTVVRGAPPPARFVMPPMDNPLTGHYDDMRGAPSVGRD